MRRACYGVLGVSVPRGTLSALEAGDQEREAAG